MVCALNFSVAWKNVSVQVCALNFYATRKNVSVRVCALNFDATPKNVGVQDRAINLALRGVHTHNNDARGVHSVGRAHRSFAGAHAMWVYVFVRNVGICCRAIV
jgi:hypothetical protein